MTFNPLAANVEYSTFKRYWESISNEKKAGYFVWPGLQGIELTWAERDAIKLYRPSGFVLFRRNMVTLGQARRLIHETRALNATWDRTHLLPPSVVAIDEEGGRVSRLPMPFPRGRPALDFSKTGETAALEAQVLHQGFVAKGLGVNCILGPVLDILTEPDNPVMGDRCYGHDAETVSRLGQLVARTLRSTGVLPCVKHFPGHGNTRTDSHLGFAKSDADLDVLRKREWVPFQKLFSIGVPLCMTAHVSLPKVDGQRPATLSPALLQQHLRGELNFTGLILSDDLRMNAIAEHYGVQKATESEVIAGQAVASHGQDETWLRRAALDALNAGCDILLCCQSIVREKTVLDTIAKEIALNSEFQRVCMEKAYRIHRILRDDL